jgi:hypothetical protein
MIEEIIGYVVTLAIGIGVAYVVFKKTGVEAKIRRIREKNIEQTNTGWGVEELENLTRLQIKKIFKTAEKTNKNLIVGMQTLGKLTRKVKVKKNLILCEIKRGFKGMLGLEKPLYFLLKEEEIIHATNKEIYVKDKIIFNQMGVYYLIDEKGVKEKGDYVRFMIEKMNYEDVTGRISNLATKVSYLDISHAQNMEALNKKIEAILKERQGEGVSVMDMASA